MNCVPSGVSLARVRTPVRPFKQGPDYIYILQTVPVTIQLENMVMSKEGDMGWEGRDRDGRGGEVYIRSTKPEIPLM